MSEIVLDLGTVSGANEIAFVQAIDSFAKWREETSGSGWMERDAPDLMVKTICKPDGSLNKAVIFQDQTWASTFMRFWQSELSQIA